MKLPRLPDTIGWRIGAIIAAVMAGTSALIALAISFGGLWARPPMDLVSILDGIAGMVNVIEAAPQEMRPRLLASATEETYHVHWYGPKDAALFEAARKHAVRPSSSFFTMLEARIHRPYVLIDPVRPVIGDTGKPIIVPRHDGDHYLAIRLRDTSWLVFESNSRTWGLSEQTRFMLRLICFVAAAIAICVLAAWQISRPIRRLSWAVHAAGVNPNGPPIVEDGPQELRELIAAFNGMQAKIAAFVAYRTAMLAAISHDLRTPLTRMRLRGEYIADPEQRRRLFSDVDEMQQMIDGALAFFRGDGDEEPVRSFDLSDLLLSIVDGFADQGIEVGYAGCDRVVYSGRAIAIKRAITNLVENSVKYGSAPAVTLMASQAGITITVCDRGPGIPASALEEVFQPFYRLDKSRHKARGGVGLGLTAARAIIRSHGGELILRNRAEGGLEAVVTLPAGGTLR